MASVDKLLEERFRHIMQDEKWIPQTISALVGGSPPCGCCSIADMRHPQNYWGSILAGALMGLALIWYKKE